MTFGRAYSYGYDRNRFNMPPFYGRDNISQLSLNEFIPRSQRRRGLNSYPRYSDYGIDPFHHEDEICDTCLLRRQDLLKGVDLVYKAQVTPCGEPFCAYFEDLGYDRLHRGCVEPGFFCCTIESY